MLYRRRFHKLFAQADEKISSQFHIVDILERVFEVFAAVVVFAECLAPLRGVDVGEVGVAAVVVHHAGDVEPVGEGQRLAVYLASADYEYLLLRREEH